MRLDENGNALARVARLLKQSTQDLVTNLRQNPSAAENMVKMQSERQHVQARFAYLELREGEREGEWK